MVAAVLDIMVAVVVVDIHIATVLVEEAEVDLGLFPDHGQILHLIMDKRELVEEDLLQTAVMKTMCLDMEGAVKTD